MTKSIIQVQYPDKYREGEFGGRPYTYYLDTGVAVAVGDIIIVPTKFGHTQARVSHINLPDGVIDERWAADVKTITAADLDEAPRASSEAAKPAPSRRGPCQQSFFSDRELTGDYGYTMEGDMS
jgi:hypothetical protein